MTDVSVSIVCHESRDAVLASIPLLVAERELQVLLVDNASRDGSAAAVREAFPHVEVLARTDRAGFGANHNLALRHARGRHVLLLNDDARVEPGAIDALSAHLDAHPEVAVAAPTVRTPAGTPEPTRWPRPSLRGDLLGLVRLGRVPEVGPGAPIGWVTGCAMMVRREAVEAAGGFDEGFFMYSEEIDLCTRLVAAGHRIDHVPEAVVVHEGQVSSGGTDSPERAVEMARSRRRYWRKHYSAPARLVAQAAVSLQFLLMALGARLRGRPARPLLLQAASCWAELDAPGLRERAAAFNRAAASAR